MSNLLKRYKVINADERVIDYNDVIRQKVNEQRKLAMQESDGFSAGLHAKTLEPMYDEDGNPVDMSAFGELGEDGTPNFSGSNFGSDAFQNNPAFAADVDVDMDLLRERADLEAAAQKADVMLVDARNQAEEILAQAKQEAESIMGAAYEDGLKKGLEDGQNRLEGEKMHIKAEYDSLAQQLAADYEQQKAQMEPELAETILEVFSKAIPAIAEHDKEIILGLVNGVFQGIDMTGSFVIRAASEDARFLLQNQGKIYCSMDKDVQFDIIEDSMMQPGQVRIEAETGIYDCSLDVELQGIISDLKLLSCMQHN